ncbi:MAG: type II secretion system F family protein [Planctomycetota bacterium]
MNFGYTAYDRSGNLQSGKIDAPTKDAARGKLESSGLYIESLVEGSAPVASPDRRDDPMGKAPPLWRGDLKRVTEFTREMAVLVSTGVPVADAVRSIEYQTRDEKWKSKVAGIRRDLESGRSLSESLAQYPSSFDPVYRSLVAAGEESGELGRMIERLAELVRRQLTVRTSLTGAMIYPSVLVFLSLSAMVTILLVVVPRFSGMFQSLNAPLPASTELLIGMSEGLRTYWPVMLGGLIGLVIAGYFWIKSDSGRRAIDLAMVRAPVISPVVRGLVESRLARVLSTLLAAHVQLLDALELVTASMTNSQYRRMLISAQDSVSAGSGLAPVLESGRLIRPSFVEAVRSGEATGKLGEVLGNLAGHIEEDNDLKVRMVSKTIEPVIITVMGAAVAFLALSMFLPLFDISAQAGGGVG